MSMAFSVDGRLIRPGLPRTDNGKTSRYVRADSIGIVYFRGKIIFR